MPEATTIYTDISPILLRMVKRLVEKKAVPNAAFIIISCMESRSVPHLMGERDVLLCPQEEATEHIEDAAGEYDTRAKASVHVVCRSRLEVDEITSDKARLTNTSVGHLQFRAKVRRALHLFWADDAQNNLMGVEPMRWLRTTKPTGDQKDPNWVSSTHEYEIIYPVDLDRPTL